MQASVHDSQPLDDLLVEDDAGQDFQGRKPSWKDKKQPNLETKEKETEPELPKYVKLLQADLRLLKCLYLLNAHFANLRFKCRKAVCIPLEMPIETSNYL